MPPKKRKKIISEEDEEELKSVGIYDDEDECEEEVDEKEAWRDVG